MTTRSVPVGVSRPDLGLVQGTDVLADPGQRGRGLRVAVEWLRAEQRSTTSHAIVGPRELERWVGAPANVLAGAIRGRRARAGLAALQQRLRSELTGRTVAVADVHGEVLPGRWWFTGAAEEIAVVDGWSPQGRGLPEIDVVLLVLAARSLAVGSDPAALTAATLDLLEEGWTPDERVALGPDWSSNDALAPSTLVLLAWLHAAAAGEAADAVVVGRSHERREIRTLLESFAPGAPGAVALRDDLLAVEVGEESEAESAVQRSTAAVAAAEHRAVERSTARRQSRRTVLGVVVGSLLWLTGTWHLDPGAMSDLGLLSILRPTAYLGLAVLLATFCVEVVAARTATWRLAAPLVALVAVLHGTPAWLYGTLRYSWAWKHLGIVDYIHRNGRVDPDPGPLDVYHGWPGFFAVNSAFTDLFGLDTAAQYARWWPVLANLAVIPALLFVFRGLRGGEDRRTGWAAVVVFLVSNWIGQDYFSPQSMAFLLYLVIVGIALRFSADGGPEARGARRWMVVVALLSAAAMITSHQVSPMVLISALAALAVTQRGRAVRLVALVVVMTLVWSVTGARVYVFRNVADLFEGFGTPVANADGNLVDQGRLSADQALVSSMGRLALVVVVIVALAGMARELVRRRVDLSALALTAAPGALLFANSFGGEIGFRSFLFALPFLSWYAALALRPGGGPGASDARSAGPKRVARGVALLLATSLLLSCFLFGYFGKDRWYHFTGSEVAAADHVLSAAEPNSLLVTITANYPGQWKRYENLVYVPIASEPEPSRGTLLADPAGRLAEWLSDEDYADGYVLLTRSQEAEVEALGVLPPGAVASLRRALAASPRFRLAFDSADAQVFELVPETPGG